MDLIDIFRAFHTNAEEYTFSSAHGTFSRIDHILSHKSKLSKFKKTEIISSIFSDHKCYETRYQLQGKNCKKHKHVEVKQSFLNHQQVTEEIKSEIKKFLETNGNENMTTQNLWDAAKAALRGKFIVIQTYLRKQEKQ